MSNENETKPAGINLGPDALGDLVRLMLLKEGREAAKEQRDVDALATRQKQRDRNAKEADSKVLLKQARCKHLKGGKNPSSTQPKNYAVSKHTFVDAKTVIRCLVCGVRWRPQDTADYFFRNGKKVANHTHAGWREAVAMFEQSSNTVTSSEIPGRILTGGEDLSGSSTDAAGLPINARIVDLEGKEVTNVEL